VLTCFCSKQCEHQNAPYIFAPIDLRCLARAVPAEEDTVVISGSRGFRSMSSSELYPTREVQRLRDGPCKLA
jgi:hypothetical protein